MALRVVSLKTCRFEGISTFGLDMVDRNRRKIGTATIYQQTKNSRCPLFVPLAQTMVGIAKSACATRRPVGHSGWEAAPSWLACFSKNTGQASIQHTVSYAWRDSMSHRHCTAIPENYPQLIIRCRDIAGIEAKAIEIVGLSYSRRLCVNPPKSIADFIARE